MGYIAMEEGRKHIGGDQQSLPQDVSEGITLDKQDKL